MIGETIRRLRQARRLTQKQLGAKVGVSAAAVTQWETGGGIDMPNLRKVAKALGVPAKVFLEEDRPVGEKSDKPGEILQDNDTSVADNGSVPKGANPTTEATHMSGDRNVGEANLNDILTRLRRLEAAVFVTSEEPASTKSDPTHRRQRL